MGIISRRVLAALGLLALLVLVAVGYDILTSGAGRLWKEAGYGWVNAAL